MTESISQPHWLNRQRKKVSPAHNSEGKTQRRIIIFITVSLHQDNSTTRLHCTSVLPGLCAVVPSVQDPRGHDNTQTVFQPYVPDHATGLTLSIYKWLLLEEPVSLQRVIKMTNRAKII